MEGGWQNWASNWLLTGLPGRQVKWWPGDGTTGVSLCRNTSLHVLVEGPTAAFVIAKGSDSAQDQFWLRQGQSGVHYDQELTPLKMDLRPLSAEQCSANENYIETLPMVPACTT